MAGYPIGQTRHVEPNDMTGDEYCYVEHSPVTGMETEPFGPADKAWYHPITEQGI